MIWERTRPAGLRSLKRFLEFAGVILIAALLMPVIVSLALVLVGILQSRPHLVELLEPSRLSAAPARRFRDL